MAIYAIGDIQGCFDEFQELLEKFCFNPIKDQLWLAGDLVNRGPKSLEVLRFVRALGEPHKIVLGNHDLRLLALWAQGKSMATEDTLHAILQASDCDDLCHWLRHQPLLVEEQRLNFMMVHAGVLPQWSEAQVRSHAHEVEQALQSANHQKCLSVIYNNADNLWREDLTGLSRWRTLVNVFTQLRYCDADGVMALTEKGSLGSQSPGLLPWYAYSFRKTRERRIVFGHWAALEGAVLGEYNVFALDAGCVWGKKLRALRLDDLQVFEVLSRQKEPV